MKETFKNYYIVKESGMSYTFTTIFNPITFDIIEEMTWNIDDTYFDNNERAIAIRNLPRSESVTKLYNHIKGKIQVGDNVKIVNGRKYKNEEKQVKKIFDYIVPNTYGKKVITYLVFNDYTKVNIDNCELVKNLEIYKIN